MEPDGRTTAWLNDDTSTLRDVGQVKFSNDLDRANYQFADVNGDGRADLIWTDKFTGDARVWQNAGELAEDKRENGSKFHWDDLGLRYQGSSRGPNTHFPSLGGQGRADMVWVNPTTGHVSFPVYFLCAVLQADSWLQRDGYRSILAPAVGMTPRWIQISPTITFSGLDKMVYIF